MSRAECRTGYNAVLATVEWRLIATPPTLPQGKTWWDQLHPSDGSPLAWVTEVGSPPPPRPLTVLIHPDLPRAEAARRLRELADWILTHHILGMAAPAPVEIPPAYNPPATPPACN